MILSRARLIVLFIGLAAVMAALVVLRTWHYHNDVTMAPHQALYSLRLSRLRQANTIAAVNGQMFYRLDSSCEGWTVDQRFNMQFVYAEGPSAFMTSNYNTWESRDGRHYSYATRRQRNGEVTDDIRGKAEVSAAGDGQIFYQSPVEQTIALPPGTLFPIQHTMAILRAAKAGDKWFNAALFDGSDLSPATDVNAFFKPAVAPYVAIEDVKPVVADKIITENKDETTAIPDSAPQPMAPADLNNNPLLKNSQAWRIQMAFYAQAPLKTDKDADDEAEPALAPDYEMTIVLHDNGVISSFVIDYPEFSLDSHLLGLKEIAKSGC